MHKYMKLNITDKEIPKTSLDFSKKENLKFVLKFKKTFFEKIVKNKWTNIIVNGSKNINILNSFKRKKFAVYQKNLIQGLKLLHKAKIYNKFDFCITYVLNLNWVSKILSKTKEKEVVGKFF